MKKRVLSCLCALLLCLGLLSPSAFVNAAGDPYFMAVNDTLLSLENQYIPILINGQYYVPYTVLDRSATGINLGIFPIYNTILNTLQIYNLEQVITFDLTAGTCTDRNGSSLSARAVTRNGQIYVPARFVCDYFGLSCSVRSTTYGPMVRICSSAAFLNDSRFVELAQMMMEDRLKEWRKDQSAEEEPVAEPTPTPTPAVTPSAPSTPGGKDPETDKSHVRTYLAFRVEQADKLEMLLGRLEQYQVRALFFFPAEDLADYDDAVRTVLCMGHAVGLLSDGTTAQEVAAQTAEGNRILAQIAHLDTCTVLAPAVTEQTVEEELAAAGILLWPADTAGEETQEERLYVLLDCADTVGSVEQTVSQLIRDRYDLRLAVETEFITRD